MQLNDKKGTILNYHQNLENKQKMYSKAAMKRKQHVIDPVDVFVVRSKDNSLTSNHRPYLLDEEGYDLEPVSDGLGADWE